MKIGYLVSNLLPSQLNFLLIKSLNQEVIKNRFLAPTVFYENLTRPCINPEFPIMQISNAYCYNGITIATTLSTAEKLIIFPSPAKKYFLVWDLEWIRLKNKNFRSLHSIYANKQLTLIARSEDHAKVIENCWNIKPLLFTNLIKYE